MRLNLNLPPELVLEVALLQLGLEQHFQGHNKFGFLLSRQIYITKFALAQWPANLKIFKSPPVRKHEAVRT